MASSTLTPRQAFESVCAMLESSIRSGNIHPSSALLLGENDTAHVAVELDADAPAGKVGSELRELIEENHLSWAVLLRPFVRLTRNGTTTSVGVLSSDPGDGATLCEVYDIDQSADPLYRICPARPGARKELLRWAEGFLPPQKSDTSS